MITVTCQHTGVQFEARSKASKNHPQVVSALDRVVKSAAGRRAYGLLMEALDSLRQAGQQPTLDEFSDLAGAAVEAAKEDRKAWVQEWQQRREARRTHREHVDEEDADRAAYAEAQAGQTTMGPFSDGDVN